MPPRDRIKLTPLKSEVMRAFWDADAAGARVRTIANAVNADRVEPLQYTTIQKVVTILRDKGAVQLVDDTARAHVYRACITREASARDLMRDVGERVLGGAMGPVVTQFVRHADLSADELRDLRRWIDEKLRDGKGS